MTLIKDLQTLLGPDHVCTQSTCSPQCFWTIGTVFHGKACAMMMPGSTSEVSEVMKLCARHNALVFTQGGNTGNAAAATPVVSDQDAKRSILLNLKRMNAIESIDPVNDTATVQAGVIVENLECRRPGWPSVCSQSCCAGLLHCRRHPCHQRWRRTRSALRQQPRTVPWP